MMTPFSRLLATAPRRALSRAQCTIGGFRTFISMKEHVVDTLTNGILESDDTYYRDGVPASAFLLPTSTPLEDVFRQHAYVDPFKLVQSDIDLVTLNINRVIGTDHPILRSIASHFFDTSGKRMRPVILCLLARALSGNAADPTTRQIGLSEITELIHTASLLHDDVIDDSMTRRGVASVHSVYGNKLAILGGDFLLARASVSLARLRHSDVTEVMATAIEHLVKGEIMQLKPSPDQEQEVKERNYVTKTYYKTASLICNSCKSIALLGDYDPAQVQIATEYGKNVGLAFQVLTTLPSIGLLLCTFVHSYRCNLVVVALLCCTYSAFLLLFPCTPSALPLHSFCSPPLFPLFFCSFPALTCRFTSAFLQPPQLTTTSLSSCYDFAACRTPSS
jgi:hypothetical protein